MNTSVYIIQRVLEYGDDVFISEAISVSETYEKALEMVKSMPDQDIAEYEIYEYEMNRIYRLEDKDSNSEIDDSRIETWEQLEEALEGLVERGIVETLIGADGEFYYKLSEGVNGIDR